MTEPGSIKEKAMKIFFMLFTCILACTLYFQFFVNTASVEVELTVAKKTDLKIYWAAENQQYSEKNMAAAIVTPEKQHYTLSLTNIGKVAKLRIDTHSYVGEATLKSLVIRQEGWAPLVWSTAEQLAMLHPLQQIVESSIDDDGLRVLSSGGDSNFELQTAPERTGLDMVWLSLRLALRSEECQYRNG